MKLEKSFKKMWKECRKKETEGGKDLRIRRQALRCMLGTKRKRLSFVQGAHRILSWVGRRQIADSVFTWGTHGWGPGPAGKESPQKGYLQQRGAESRWTVGGGGNWVVAHPRSYISSFQVALLSEVKLSFLKSLTVRQPEEARLVLVS